MEALQKCVNLIE